MNFRHKRAVIGELWLTWSRRQTVFGIKHQLRYLTSILNDYGVEGAVMDRSVAILTQDEPTSSAGGPEHGRNSTLTHGMTYESSFRKPPS